MVTFKKLGRLGRFGNQLFQYVGTRLYSEINGFTSAMPHWIGCDIFDQIKDYSFDESLRSKFLPTVQLSDLKKSNRLHQLKYLLGLAGRFPKTITMEELYLNPMDNISLFGYMQDKKSIEIISKCKEKVLNWYKFKPRVVENFHKVSKQFGNYLGIHIRRRDFIKRGFCVPTVYYREWIEKNNIKGLIYISSDDPTISKEFSKFDVIEIKNPLPDIPDFIFDFWMLTKSQTLLGCGSTFSWWAAYLGNHNSYFSPPLTHSWPDDHNVSLEKIDI